MRIVGFIIDLAIIPFFNDNRLITINEIINRDEELSIIKSTSKNLDDKASDFLFKYFAGSTD